MDLEYETEEVAKAKKRKESGNNLEKDMNAFLDEIEQDKFLRSKINLYKVW